MKKVIAIDLGGTKISAAVVTEDGKILHKLEEATHLKDGWAGLKQQIIHLCKTLLKSEKNILAIGVGSAGPLNAQEGTLLDPTNFGWASRKKIYFKKELVKALKKPLVFDNDAVAAVLGEAWKGKASPNSIAITLGTGLGVGILIDGKVLRGRAGLHPETGHLVLTSQESYTQCECGVSGCAEGFLSGVNFAKRISRKNGLSGLTAKDLVNLAKQGDAKILESFDEYSRLMAQFICSLIIISYPRQIVLSGSFSEASPLFLAKAIKLVTLAMQHRQKSQKIIPEIRVSKLKNQSGLLGAAFMALHYKT